MNYSLPKKVTIDGEEHAIRYDFRCILDIISMLNEQELTESEKAKALIYMFYVDPEKIRDPNEAIEKCFEFIDNGESKGKKSPKLIDWEQDFNYIVAPISRVVGKDIRETEYDEETNTGGFHWWSFLSAYMEIGPDCLFSQIVNIRDKKARGKKLEKHEQEWARRNSDLIEIKNTYTDEDEELIDKWTGGYTNAGRRIRQT